MNVSIGMTNGKLWISAALCAAVVAMAVSIIRADDNSKSVIKDIMKADMKGDTSLAKRVGAGKATPDDVAKLLADVKLLEQETPKLGTKDDWTNRTQKLDTALAAIQSGDKDGLAQYKTAMNCKACHELHKAKH